MNTHLPLWPYIKRADIIEIEDCQISSWSCCDTERGIWEFKTEDTVCGKGFGPWHMDPDDTVVQIDDHGACKVNLVEWDPDYGWVRTDKLITVRFLMLRPVTVNEIYPQAA